MKTVKEILAEYQDLPDYCGLGEKLTSVNQHALCGDTPLHTAAWRESLEEVKSLLSNGADPNAAGEYGSRPLHVAVICKNENIIEELLRAGAKCELKDDEGHDVWHEANVMDCREALDRIVRQVSC